MQEFCENCEDGGGENPITSRDGMLLILPYWPRLYNRLASDTDRRVREATQKAHSIRELNLRHIFYVLQSNSAQCDH